MAEDSEYAALIQRLGFVADPFAKTNADEEERLDSHFIQPPFYGTVFGTPKSPKSTVVFAPRGGGKTALKRKIEIASRESSFLCVTYNTFPVVEKLWLKDITAEYHLRNLVRLVLIVTRRSASCAKGRTAWLTLTTPTVELPCCYLALLVL